MIASRRNHGITTFGKDGSFDSTRFAHGTWSLAGDRLVVKGTHGGFAARRMVGLSVSFPPVIFGKEERNERDLVPSAIEVRTLRTKPNFYRVDNRERQGCRTRI